MVGVEKVAKRALHLAMVDVKAKQDLILFNNIHKQVFQLSHSGQQFFGCNFIDQYLKIWAMDIPSLRDGIKHGF